MSSYVAVRISVTALGLDAAHPLINSRKCRQLYRAHEKGQ